jgi:hypothetical protein
MGNGIDTPPRDATAYWTRRHPMALRDLRQHIGHPTGG